jgi:hypothetical protein
MRLQHQHTHAIQAAAAALVRDPGQVRETDEGFLCLRGHQHQTALFAANCNNMERAGMFKVAT